MVEASRRGSAQIVQGSLVSMLPQVEQTMTEATATSIASASGTRSWSFFLMRCSAARRAERGPRPGSFAEKLDQALDLGAGDAAGHGGRGWIA